MRGLETDAEADYPADRDGFRAPRRPRQWTFFLIVIGTIAVYGSMLAAQGNGWSPLVFLLLGAVGTPVMARVFVHFSRVRRWPARLVAMLAMSAISFGLAKWSTLANPSDTYARMFKSPAPVGMTLIKSRKQWFDGVEILTSFNANRASVLAMLAARPFKDESDSLGHRPVFMSSQLDKADLIPARLTNEWNCDIGDMEGKIDLIDIVWDETSGNGAIWWVRS